MLKNGYFELISEIDSLLEKNFDLLDDSLRDANTEKAEKVKENFGKAKENIDKIIEKLLNDQKLNRKELVLYSLLARYLKRVGAHQKNAASTVINPFERIGYKK